MPREAGFFKPLARSELASQARLGEHGDAAVCNNPFYRTGRHRVKMQGSMPSTTANSERRHNSRKRPPSLIYVELGSANGGMMRDLSEDGFALRAMMPLHVGEGISFSFLLDPLIRIEGQGEV